MDKDNLHWSLICHNNYNCHLRPCGSNTATPEVIRLDNIFISTFRWEKCISTYWTCVHSSIANQAIDHAFSYGGAALLEFVIVKVECVHQWRHCRSQQEEPLGHEVNTIIHHLEGHCLRARWNDRAMFSIYCPIHMASRSQSCTIRIKKKGAGSHVKEVPFYVALLLHANCIEYANKW